MALYSIDMKVCATLYVKAASPEEAKKMADAWGMLGIEAEGKDFSGIGFAHSDLPKESFSPAMTVHGLWDSSVVLVDDTVE